MDDTSRPTAAQTLRPSSSGADDLAYVIFTSGSTGQQKGVEVTHGAVINLLDAARRSPGFTSGDVVLALANLAFDVAVMDIFLPLTTGGRLVLATREDAMNFDQLAGLVDRSGPTFMQATPTTWAGLVETGWRGSPRLKILSGADVLRPTLAEQLLARGQEVWNMYGPTEATVWCTQHRVRPGDDPIPIGRPVEGMRVHVAGPDGREAGVDEVGELLIGGPSLFRGYHKAPGLTQACLVERPAISGGRLYRSGDLGRRRSDGRLDWLGRLDGQVKVRGHRVEIGDIEAALLSHPKVAAAAVAVYAEGGGSAALTAYVTARQSASPPAIPELRRWIRERRPIYCVPQRVVLLAAMPLTAGGKIDRNQLRDIAAARE